MKGMIYLSAFIYGASIVYCLMCVISLNDKYRTLEYKYEELKKKLDKKPKHMKLYEGEK